ncbi:uncharacterized protein LOC111045173 isoform X1 [Nilaparvata lugens]|uniref:uncharacterized protein LOC111045173 isoform X1 n=1 Tax=Nilaparvata lugens TaxID=108931 RepID=UPI000B98E7C7|nr:uncharacterized protein LOC111045173 isoform X1 [Nilaparvata lugens]
MSAAQGFTFSLICVLVSLQSHLMTCDALCYFPTELQGEFLMQSSAGGMGKSEIQYSYVNITGDSIPIWGICYRRIGSNYILLDSSSGDNCIRCFHLTLKSRNVLLVRTEGLGKCYTSEAAAEATCLHSMTHHMTELLLFKEREVGGEEISKAFCPVHGKFTFVYNIDDGTEDKMECANSDSVIDSCMIPIQASSISLHFQGCSFGDVDNLTFHCLGDWEGPGNQRYVAFLNPSEGSNGRPRYRCALYHTDRSGKVFIAFSSDSTCTSNLYNSTTGYETMVLTPSKEQEYPPKVLMSVCRLPAWMQGTWEHLTVNGQIMSFADHSSFRMYQIRCIGTPNPATNYFPVFIRDECGGEAYNCIWVEKRASNVLEFQLGMNPSAVYNESLCINSNFPNREWITQGRLDRLDESPCPITGEYTGLIPDNSGLCAKLSSDCKSKEIMYYTMSECVGKNIYEERDYRCLGQWEEDGLMYTYTQRRDIGTYECFVGSIISDTEIYIKEAGEHCERSVNPLHLGMKLTNKGKCTDGQHNPIPSDTGFRQTPYPPHPTMWHSTRQPYVTKPWKPITAPPRIRNEVLNGGHVSTHATNPFIAFCTSVLFVFYTYTSLS